MKPRVSKALSAMVALGISREEARQTLKRLYLLYEKNWEFIEAENYRALVDAIFEDKGEEGTTNKREAKGESYTVNGKRSDHLEREFDEPGSKKQCLTQQEANVSPRVNSNNHQEGSLPLILAVKPIPCLIDLEDDSSGSDSSEKNNIHFLPSTSSSKIEQDLGRECCSIHRTTCKHYSLDVASSKAGDVKLSLIYDKTSGQSFTSSPKMDTVLQAVEGKFLRSHLSRDPVLSMLNLLEGICECFSEQCKVKDEPVGIKALCNLSSQAVTIRSSDRALALINVENGRKPHHFIDDISKGKEKVKISLLDESGKGDIPSFFYTPQNIVYQNAHVSISLARISDDDSCPACSGDCLSSSVPCACARETSGEFAYTSNGLLKEDFLNSCISLKRDPQKHHYVYCQDCPHERVKNDVMPEPCKGHLLRRFVKECWSKCGCDMQCGNRVVQRGISRSLQVFWTAEGKGWGLRCTEHLPKGAFVCEYIGEIMTNMELYERNLQNSSKRHTYPVNLDADWGSESILKDEEALCLDATVHGNVARFINHRCYDSNLLDIPVEVETLDRHYYHLAFFTAKEVQAYEELTWPKEKGKLIHDASAIF
ncbi:hypothetical protein V2J09_022612 [Rumex salicifolius]